MRLLPVIFLLNSVFLFGQDDTNRTKPPAPGQFAALIPLRIVLRDYNFGYGWRLDWHYTLELRAGYVHPFKPLDNIYQEWFMSPEMKFQGPSIYGQLNRWSYNKNLKRTFKGLIVGYRYVWYYNKELRMGGIGGNSDAESPTLSQWRNDLYLLFSWGIQTSRITTTEITIGARIMYTHTHVIDTKFHNADPPDQYEEYKDKVRDDIPNAEGIGIAPVLRITSRFGWFEW